MLFRSETNYLRLTAANFSAGVARLVIRGLEDAKGVYQTAIGKAGQLTLSVCEGPTAEKLNSTFVTSSGFSVAALPVAIEMKLHKGPLAGSDLEKLDGLWWPAFGASYEVLYHSDSGNVKDLDAVSISERLQRVAIAEAKFAQYKRLGGALVVGTFNPGFNPTRPANKPILDANANSAGYGKEMSLADAKNRLIGSLKKQIDLDGTGAAQVYQFFVYYEARTGWDPQQNFGVQPIVVKESGFLITYDEKKYSLTLSKAGFANNGAAKGRIAAADSGPFLDKYE